MGSLKPVFNFFQPLLQLSQRQPSDLSMQIYGRLQPFPSNRMRFIYPNVSIKHNERVENNKETIKNNINTSSCDADRCIIQVESSLQSCNTRKHSSKTPQRRNNTAMTLTCLHRRVCSVPSVCIPFSAPHPQRLRIPHILGADLALVASSMLTVRHRFRLKQRPATHEETRADTRCFCRSYLMISAHGRQN